jgi:hypothetical protein
MASARQGLKGLAGTIGFFLGAILLSASGTATFAQDNNTAYGTGALQNNNNTVGTNNSAFGFDALYSNTTGPHNTASGSGALFSNTIGSGNTASGALALYSNTIGSGNTASGDFALSNNTIGSGNTASGDSALASNTTGGDNTASGEGALFSNTGGSYNTASGGDALTYNTTGNDNTASGITALANNTTGSFNIGLGFGAGSNIVAGSHNIEIGSSGTADESHTIRIGTQTTQTTTFIAGISGTPIRGSVDVVVVNRAGRLGILPSSARYKRDIKDMGVSSAPLMKLRPVTFRYKQDKSNERQYGLVAEEVQRLYPELVTLDAGGRPLSVHYQELIPMLLNELQKESKESQKQAAEIQRLSAQLVSNERKIAELQAGHDRELRTLEVSFEQRLSALEQATHTGTLRLATLMR